MIIEEKKFPSSIKGTNDESPSLLFLSAMMHFAIVSLRFFFPMPWKIMINYGLWCENFQNRHSVEWNDALNLSAALIVIYEVKW